MLRPGLLLKLLHLLPRQRCRSNHSVSSRRDGRSRSGGGREVGEDGGGRHVARVVPRRALVAVVVALALLLPPSGRGGGVGSDGGQELRLQVGAGLDLFLFFFVGKKKEEKEEKVLSFFPLHFFPEKKNERKKWEKS